MRIAAALTAVLALNLSAAAQQVQPTVFTLDNGMKFLLVPRTDQPNVIAAGWVAKVGSVNERPGITGISHFFEHMMFKGTDTIGTGDPKRDAEFRARQKMIRDKINMASWTTQYQRYRNGEIDDPWNPIYDTPEIKDLRAQLKALMDEQQGRVNAEQIAAKQKELAAAAPAAQSGLKDEIAALEADQKSRASIVKDEFDQIYTKGGGSGMNAFTSNDVTFYFINIPSNKLELWAWMESDRLSNSVFREFFSERDVVHEERRLRTESTPTGTFQEQFDAMFWISSGYSWPVIGWPSDLNSYTMEEALRYWNIYYKPNNLCGVIVGDFKVEDARALVERYFGRLQASSTPVPEVVTLEHQQVAEMRMNAEVEAQPQIEVRYHTVGFRHADSYALDVLSEILNGRTGRLYKGMVEGSEVASSANAQNEARKYAGVFSVSAETKGEATPAQLEAGWYEQLARIQNEPVPEREMLKVKNQLDADNYRRLQANFMLLLQLGYGEALGGWEEINEAPAKLQAVTAADIQRVAKKYFTETNRSVATFTRKAGAAQESADPELAALPAPMQARAKQAVAMLAQETDPAQLRMALEQMEAQAAQIPPQMKPMIDFMKKKLLQRIAELEAAGAGAPATEPATEPAAEPATAPSGG